MPGLTQNRDPVNKNNMEGSTSAARPSAIDCTPDPGLKKAGSLEALNKIDVFVPIQTGLLPAASMDHIQNVSEKQPFLRRNRSFDDYMRKFTPGTQVWDFADDSDTWSQASYDSQCSGSSNPQTSSNRRGFSLSSFSKMGENDEVKSSKNTEKQVESSPMKVPTRKGMSHTMVMNWLTNKKYPTIEETNETCLTPVTGISPGTAGAELGVEQAAKTLTSFSLANLDVETGLPRKDANVPTIKVTQASGNKNTKFSFRDLNAVSPSYF